MDRFLLRETQLLLQIALLIIVSLLLFGCGKYGPPLAPEVLAPQAVQNLRASAMLGEVRIQWESPQRDRRGRELKFIDGYDIYRADLLADQPMPSFLAIKELYTKVAFLPDNHIEERDRLRSEARELGQPLRRVRVDPELMSFVFVDRDLEGGKRYIYQVRPVNQRGVEGQVLQTVDVFYRGDLSEVFVGRGNMPDRDDSLTEEGEEELLEASLEAL